MRPDSISTSTTGALLTAFPTFIVTINHYECGVLKIKIDEMNAVYCAFLSDRLRES